LPCQRRRRRIGVVDLELPLTPARLVELMAEDEPARPGGAR